MFSGCVGLPRVPSVVSIVSCRTPDCWLRRNKLASVMIAACGSCRFSVMRWMGESAPVTGWMLHCFVQSRYQMPPREAFIIAQFLTASDIERCV